MAQKLPTGCFDCCLMPTTAHGRHTTMCNCCIKASVHRIRLFSITMKSCTESYKLRSETILRLPTSDSLFGLKAKEWLGCHATALGAMHPKAQLASNPKRTVLVFSMRLRASSRIELRCSSTCLHPLSFPVIACRCCVCSTVVRLPTLLSTPSTRSHPCTAR